MKPTESTATPARAAHGQPAAAKGAPAAEAPGDAFAALLGGLCPEASQAPALPGAALVEDPAAPAKSPKAPAAPDAVLPDAFLLALPAVPAVPLANAAAGSAPATGTSSPLREAAPDTGKAGAAAGWAAAAANDMHFGPAEAAPARPGAFQAVLAAAAAGSSEPARPETAAAVLAPDALALPPALGAAHASTLDAATPAVPVHQATLAAHPQSPAFAADLGTELRWMVEAGVQQAELHLNPSELGPIQVQLTLNAQTAEIHFAAVHATTRESIQQALPALREMLAGEGLQLGQAGVSGGDAGREFAQQQAQAQERANRAAAGPAAAAGAASAPAPRATPRAGRGMLDLYA